MSNHLNQQGKKATQWKKDRAKLIADAVLSGRITLKNGYPEGICADCHEWHPLDPDHRLKRSLGGSNESENIDWVCRKCHNLRDNMGDPNKKKTHNTKKPNWQTAHQCKHCKQTVSTLLCTNCGKLSI